MKLGNSQESQERSNGMYKYRQGRLLKCALANSLYPAYLNRTSAHGPQLRGCAKAKAKSSLALTPPLWEDRGMPHGLICVYSTGSVFFFISISENLYKNSLCSSICYQGGH